MKQTAKLGCRVLVALLCLTRVGVRIVLKDGSATVDAWYKVCKVCFENIVRHDKGEDVLFTV